MSLWMKDTYRLANSNLPAIRQAGMFLSRSDESRKSGTAVRGFINYLKKYQERKAINREP